jgi:hypothetical protein
MSHRSESFSVLRGLRSAGIAAACGAVIPLALPVGLWAIGYDTHRHLGYDLRETPEQIVVSSIGCAVLLALASWASFAPAGRHSFTRSLTLIFLSTLCVWLAAASSGLAPTCPKGTPASERYLRKDPFLLLPPLIATGLLTWFRARRTSDGQAEPSDGAESR